MTGNLGYFVNADAVTWWLREVWPVLRRVRPGCGWWSPATGRPGVRRAVREAGGEVELIASPRDLPAILRQATLALAPMRCGAGCPSSAGGLGLWRAGRGLPLGGCRDLRPPGRGLPGRRPAPHSIGLSAIQELLDSPGERQRLADNGRRRLAADYSRETVYAQLRGVVDDLAAGH